VIDSSAVSDDLMKKDESNQRRQRPTKKAKADKKPVRHSLIIYR